MCLRVVQLRPANKRACVRRKNVWKNVSRQKKFSSLATLLLSATPAFVACNEEPAFVACNETAFVACNEASTPCPAATKKCVAPATCATSPRELQKTDIDRQEFVKNVRKVQHRTHCTTKTCLEFIQLFEQYVDGQLPKDFVKADKKLKQAAGIDVIELNGCSACHGHVYGPEDKRAECPCCGASRYDAKGKAQEVFILCRFIE